MRSALPAPDPSATRHQKVAGRWIDYGFSRTAGAWGFMVAFSGNWYRYEADAVAFAKAHPISGAA